MLERFQQNHMMLRRKVLKIFGGAFSVFGADGELLFYSKQKAFKLKEDIRLYTDKEGTHEVLTILARSVIDFSASYDVVDAENQTLIGTLKRHGFSSLARDRWSVFDADGDEVGMIIEDSAWKAFLRRFLSNLIPQTFYFETAGEERAEFRQHFNPFIFKLDIDLTEDANAFDRIMAVSGAILLAAIEGRQDG